MSVLPLHHHGPQYMSFGKLSSCNVVDIANFCVIYLCLQYATKMKLYHKDEFLTKEYESVPELGNTQQIQVLFVCIEPTFTASQNNWQ